MTALCCSGRRPPPRFRAGWKRRSREGRCDARRSPVMACSRDLSVSTRYCGSGRDVVADRFLGSSQYVGDVWKLPPGRLERFAPRSCRCSRSAAPWCGPSKGAYRFIEWLLDARVGYARYVFHLIQQGIREGLIPSRSSPPLECRWEPASQN